MSSFQFILRHKTLFSIILLLQLFFFVSVSVILAAFTPLIINSTEAIMEYVSAIDINQARFDMLAQRQPLTDSLKVEAQYVQAQRSAFLMVFFLAASYVLVHACIWFLLKRKFFLRTLGTVLLMCIGWILFLFSSFSTAMLSLEINSFFMILLMIIGLVIVYFAPILLVHAEDSFKRFVKKAFSLGINRFPRILLIYGSVLLIYVLLALILFFVYNLHILFFAFVMLLSIAIIAWTKVFLYLELKESV